MTSSRDYSYYKEHAQDVKLKDITSSEQNKDIMQKLRDGDPDFTSLYIILNNDINDNEEEFFVLEGDDLDWLGYFVGESKSLKFLRLSCYPFPPVGLLEGICRNRSIQDLEFSGKIVDTTFIHLAPFFGKNDNLTKLTLGCDRVGSDECAQYFLMAFHKCNSLKHLCFGVSADGSQFSDEAFNNIIRVLHSQTELERLDFDEQFLGRDACATLSNTLRLGGMKKLRTLDLTNNYIDDDGLMSLVAGMEHCQNLDELSLYGNEIRVAGLRSLSSFLQSESCRLESLNLGCLHIDDEGAIVLATGLTDYTLLKNLNLSYNIIGDAGASALVSALSAAANESLLNLQIKDNRFSEDGIRSLSALIQQSEGSCLKLLDLGGWFRDADHEAVARILANALTNNTSLISLGYTIPESGEEAFSRLLCDTSSINNIYSSNHTLEIIGNLDFYQDDDITNQDIKRYLSWNRSTRHLEPRQRQLVPMCKVLFHYPDLADMNMKPFYKWKLKFLPLVADWLFRASAIRNWLDESVKVFERRELSGLYKFIRGVPLLVVNGYWSQQLKQIQVKKRNFDEANKQLLEILAKKRKLEEEEMQVLHRLGGKRESD